jgi:DNA-damage-inducible protein D
LPIYHLVPLKEFKQVGDKLMVTDFNLSLQGTVSPFDRLRRIDENGKEYWSARELMPLLGYSKWQNFFSAIENAIENLETVTENVDNHFLLLEVKSLGRPSVDYKLTRLASYHVAMACDSRGNEQVKMAKHYFVVKTRQAELQQAPVQPKLPSRVVALETAECISGIYKHIGEDNPRLAQFLIDHAISDLMPSSNNLLVGEELKGVVEIAEEMGLPVNIKNRSQLGKFVKSSCGHLAIQEKRLVNGRMQPVACYPCYSEEVKEAIQQFFA